MSIRIPEGFAFVPHASGVAGALLNAADAIGADRQLGIRRVSGGYHVALDIADVYREYFPEPEDEEASEQATEVVLDADGNVVTETPVGEKVELETLPVTADNTHDEIDAYAKSLDPVVEFPAGTNKADKIALLEAARAPKTDAPAE